MFVHCTLYSTHYTVFVGFRGESVFIEAYDTMYRRPHLLKVTTFIHVFTLIQNRAVALIISEMLKIYKYIFLYVSFQLFRFRYMRRQK